MSTIQSSCALVGWRSALSEGTARCRTVRSIAYTTHASASTASPIHSRRPAFSAFMSLGPACAAELSVPDELDAVVERVQLAEDLDHLRQPVEREERAGDEEERRQHRADDVAEVVDRLRVARDRDAEVRPAEAGDEGDARHDEHPPRRIEAEEERDDER